MTTDHPESDVDVDDILSEPEAQPDAVRPTDDSEDVAEKIAEDQAGRRPQGD